MTGNKDKLENKLEGDGSQAAVDKAVEFLKSTDDDRTRNNVMRHEYRVLSDEEKMQMKLIKDLGLDFVQLLDRMGNSRELSIAKTNVEQAVMWAVKHLTK